MTKLIECCFCEQKFHTMQQRCQHHGEVHKNIKGYGGNRYFKCSLCEFIFEKYEEISDHIDEEHCDIFKSSFCKECNKSFKNIKQHTWQEHNIQTSFNSKEEEIEIIWEDFQCRDCLEFVSDLKKHTWQKHENRKRYRKDGDEIEVVWEQVSRSEPKKPRYDFLHSVRKN